MIFLVPFYGCKNKSENKENRYTQITQSQAAEMMKTEKKYVILDVRTWEEFEQGYIPNEICVPDETIPDKESS